MKVRDVMTTRGLLTVGEHDEVGLACQIMLWAGRRYLPVVRGREVVGVVSERDLAYGGHGSRAAVASAMSSPAITVPPDFDLGEAVSLLVGRQLGCLPVVDGGALVGMLTRNELLHDLMQSTDAAP